MKTTYQQFTSMPTLLERWVGALQIMTPPSPSFKNSSLATGGLVGLVVVHHQLLDVTQLRVKLLKPPLLCLILDILWEMEQLLTVRRKWLFLC